MSLREWILGCEVREAEAIRRGFRIAYYKAWSKTARAWPLGLHWLVMAGRVVWQWTFYVKHGRSDLVSYYRHIAHRAEQQCDEMSDELTAWRRSFPVCHYLEGPYVATKVDPPEDPPPPAKGGNWHLGPRKPR